MVNCGIMLDSLLLGSAGAIVLGMLIGGLRFRSKLRCFQDLCRRSLMLQNPASSLNVLSDVTAHSRMRRRGFQPSPSQTAEPSATALRPPSLWQPQHASHGSRPLWPTLTNLAATSANSYTSTIPLAVSQVQGQDTVAAAATSPSTALGVVFIPLDTHEGSDASDSLPAFPHNRQDSWQLSSRSRVSGSSGSRNFMEWQGALIPPWLRGMQLVRDPLTRQMRIHLPHVSVHELPEDWLQRLADYIHSR